MSGQGCKGEVTKLQFINKNECMGPLTAMGQHGIRDEISNPVDTCFSTAEEVKR
jgi:hypothetical protein